MFVRGALLTAVVLKAREKIVFLGVCFAAFQTIFISISNKSLKLKLKGKYSQIALCYGQNYLCSWKLFINKSF